MRSVSLSSCRRSMFASCVHPMAVLNAAFCITCSLLMLVQDARGDHIEELQTTQPTSGGAVTSVWQIVSMGARLPFLASRPCGPAGWLAMLLIKAGYVETNPGPTTLNKRVWICDICYKQIQVMKQISIRCNRIEHGVHLRCAGIRQAQYTDTWTYHLHIESRLTTHTDITAPATPDHGPTPYTLPTYTTAIKTQTHVQHPACSHRIGKAQTQSSHPLTPLSTLAMDE